jgi:hypothetical protein
VTSYGRPLQLVGLNRSGSEYRCIQGYGIFDGPTDATAIAAMKSWHINAVRVPLNEDCWLGINGAKREYSGAAYRSEIKAFVQRLNAAGLYVILDAHWNAPGRSQAMTQQSMLDADHGYALWRSIASTFRSNQSVLFDLYNEPHNLGGSAQEEWRCWAQGCAGYAGMDRLVKAVRSAGARNVILLAGLGWASEDSEWLRYEPNDPLHQLAATFHVYGGHSVCTEEECWSRTLVPLATHVPIVADEFGETHCGEAKEVAWLKSWMRYASTHGFSMLAWTWDTWPGKCSEGPTLITSYAGAPTPYGAAVKSYYARLGA